MNFGPRNKITYDILDNVSYMLSKWDSGLAVTSELIIRLFSPILFKGRAPMNTYFRRSSLNKYMYSFGTIVTQEFEPPSFICSLESAMKNTPINFEVRKQYPFILFSYWCCDPSIWQSKIQRKHWFIHFAPYHVKLYIIFLFMQ